MESAEDLLGALAHHPDGEIDVICTTLGLPDAQGLDVIRSFREQAGDVPMRARHRGRRPTARVRRGRDRRDPGRCAGRSRRAIGPLRGDGPAPQRGLQRHQTVDDLTGLLNARGFELLATHHLRLADRSSTRSIVIVFVRMDEVPEPERDRAVVDAAGMIRSAVRASDVVARVDPDAFCVLLSGASPGTGSIVLSRVVEAVMEHDSRTRRQTGSTLWVGAAEYDPEQPQGIKELIAEADRRMRRAGAEP